MALNFWLVHLSLPLSGMLIYRRVVLGLVSHSIDYQTHGLVRVKQAVEPLNMHVLNTYYVLAVG